MLKFLGIIPARYASTRFPAKPLAMLGGKTVIQRVYEQVAGILDDAYVATDDERIEEAVKAFGGKVVMTSVNHKSGTDRCYEAYTKIGGDFDVIVNIQGDEPFIQPSQLETVKACFDDITTQIATLVKPFTPENGFEALENINSPKVVLNKNMNALYFSRSIIPYQRNAEKQDWCAGVRQEAFLPILSKGDYLVTQQQGYTLSTEQAGKSFSLYFSDSAFREDQPISYTITFDSDHTWSSDWQDGYHGKWELLDENLLLLYPPEDDSAYTSRDASIFYVDFTEDAVYTPLFVKSETMLPVVQQIVLEDEVK